MRHSTIRYGCFLNGLVMAVVLFMTPNMFTYIGMVMAVAVAVWLPVSVVLTVGSATMLTVQRRRAWLMVVPRVEGV